MTIPDFGGLPLTIAAFIVALSIVVAVHEYGHYIVGRWCGIHAEVFSLGFGPVLYSRVDRRGTKWQVAALPFGGYVKFLGDADAASGKDGDTISELSNAELKRTMHGADLWRRSATVAAGPIFNFILSIFVFTGVFMFSGTQLDEPVIGKLKPLPGQEDLFEQGDRIISVGGIETPDLSAFNTVIRDLPPSETVPYVVLRNDEEIRFDSVFPFPPILDAIRPRSAAIDVDMKVGDVIQSVDGTPVYAFKEVENAVLASAGKPMVLSVWRNGETYEVTLKPRRRDILSGGEFETRWLIGFSSGMFFTPPAQKLGPLDALWGGVVQTWYVITSSVSGLYHMIIGKISSCNIQGPIGLAKVSGDMASLGLIEFIGFVAVLSTAIGFLNLFPIPVLDGGHLVFHAYEAIFRRPPNDRVLHYLMMGGLTFLLSVMLFALSNDLFCT